MTADISHFDATCVHTLQALSLTSSMRSFIAACVLCWYALSVQGFLCSHRSFLTPFSTRKDSLSQLFLNVAPSDHNSPIDQAPKRGSLIKKLLEKRKEVLVETVPSKRTSSSVKTTSRIELQQPHIYDENSTDDREETEILSRMALDVDIEQPESEDFKSGFVCIVGNPNVGKSTLLNAILGQKLCIVSPKPQTTRHRIHGVLTEPDYQIVFSDTPGMLQPSYTLHQTMRDVVSFHPLILL